MMVVGAACFAGNPLGFPEYTQTVTATFATPADAAAAQAVLASLPGGAACSFGTRWDDTNPRHLAKAAMLEQIGVKGAFYIVSGTRRETPQSFRIAGIRELIRRGHAIGNHTVTHPFVLDLSPEAMFAQFLRCRIDLECDTDHSVVSYASPYGWYQNRWMDSRIKALAVKMLPECGLWVSGDNPIADAGVPDDLLYPANRFSADDKNPNYDRFQAGLKAQMAVAARSPRAPRITLGTHSWCDDAGNAKQQAWLKKHCVRDDWVQLNDYEYGAYRYSALNGSVARQAATENRAVFVVRRFDPAALGDGIPLSLSFSKEPSGVECGGKPLTRGANGTWTLPHDASRHTVAKVGLAGEDGMCEKLPGLALKVVPDLAARKVTVTFRNGSAVALHDVYGVVHLPPEFSDRRRTFLITSVDAGSSVERVIEGGAAEKMVYPSGSELYAASLDFSQGDERARLWAVSTVEVPKKMTPRDVVRWTGIVPAATIDDGKLMALSAETGPLSLLGDDVKWLSPPANPSGAWYLVTPGGRSMSKAETAAATPAGAAVFAFQFAADAGANVEMLTNIAVCDGKAAVFLNGAKLPVGRSRMRIPVRKGTNRIVARIGVKADKYTKAVQMAICENGELCTPCTPVLFPEGLGGIK